MRPSCCHHAADQLHIEMAHIESAPGRFPAGGEGFGQNIIERLINGDAKDFRPRRVFGDASLLFEQGFFAALFFERLCKSLFELSGFGFEFVVAHFLELRFQSVDFVHYLAVAIDIALISIE